MSDTPVYVLIALVLAPVLVSSLDLPDYAENTIESCVPEGQAGADCCAGLTAATCFQVINGSCERCDGHVCISCGNGICGPGENYCNCPVDCECCWLEENHILDLLNNLFILLVGLFVVLFISVLIQLRRRVRTSKAKRRIVEPKTDISEIVKKARSVKNEDEERVKKLLNRLNAEKKHKD